MDARRDISINLQLNVRRVLPEAELKIMGGAGNTFALRNSDLDLCIVSTMGINVYELNMLVSEFKREGKLPQNASYIPELYIPWC
jgi:DNA polymerase sigma